MPRLNVTDVLYDPDFCEIFTLIRRCRTVDDFGRGAVKENILRLVGVVQPASSKTLERLNQGDWKKGGIEVWCESRMTVNSNKNLPDEIVFENNRYMCVEERDYTHYGRGYMKIAALLLLGEDGYDADSGPISRAEIIVDPAFDYTVNRLMGTVSITPELTGDLNG